MVSVSRVSCAGRGGEVDEERVLVGDAQVEEPAEPIARHGSARPACLPGVNDGTLVARAYGDAGLKPQGSSPSPEQPKTFYRHASIFPLAGVGR